mgnify:CR=1 FL=1
MKTLNTFVKILTALAAVAGAVYLVAAYGDKIVAWAKRVIGCCPWDEGMEEPAEEAPAAEEPKAEEPAEAPEVHEPAAESNEPIADEGDFEG